MYLKNYQFKIVIKRKSLKMFMIYYLSRGLRYVNAIQFREDKDDRETARIIWRVTQVAMSHINIDYILHVFILFIFTSLICTILVARRLIISECVHRVYDVVTIRTRRFATISLIHRQDTDGLI